MGAWLEWAWDVVWYYVLGYIFGFCLVLSCIWMGYYLLFSWILS